jgi:hypothetical protein
VASAPVVSGAVPAPPPQAFALEAAPRRGAQATDGQLGPARSALSTAATQPRAAVLPPSPVDGVRQLVDDALKAVTAAQTCLDDDSPTSTTRAQAQLARAVAALVRLGEELN